MISISLSNEETKTGDGETVDLLKNIQKALDEINTREKEKDTSQQEVTQGESNQYTELLSEVKEIKTIQSTQLTWFVWLIVLALGMLIIAYIYKIFRKFS